MDEVPPLTVPTPLVWMTVEGLEKPDCKRCDNLLHEPMFQEAAASVSLAGITGDIREMTKRTVEAYHRNGHRFHIGQDKR